MGQQFGFGMSDCLIAEAGGVGLDRLHWDVDAILTAYEKVKPLAQRLGVDPPVPRLAGFTYPHVASLGAEIVFPEDSEPRPLPLLRSAEDIERLTEPDNYLAAPLIQKRLHLAQELKKRCPQAPDFIGHLYEGPVTTAALLLGPDFFTLPHDNPALAHRLLAFSVRSALNYSRAFLSHIGHPRQQGPASIPDDFAGIFSPPVFREFVLPYWDEMYRGLQATSRNLHSELLRAEHLPMLKDVNIALFDPSADQYLTPDILKEHCPCPFTLRIQSWYIHDLSTDELEAMYRKLASYRPHSISFHMETLESEPKVARLLKVARELRGD